MPQSVLCHSVNPDHFQQQFRSQKQKQWKHHSSLRRSLILRLLLQLAYLAPHGRRRRRCVAASYRRLRERWNREYLSRFFVIRNFSNVGTISNRNKPKKIANWPHVKSHSLLSRSTFLIFRRALDMATAGHKIETPSFLWPPLQDWHSEENLAWDQVAEIEALWCLINKSKAALRRISVQRCVKLFLYVWKFPPPVQPGNLTSHAQPNQPISESSGLILIT